MSKWRAVTGPSNAQIAEETPLTRGVEPDPAPEQTFLFTDVEGSTRLWEQFPVAMRAALERHEVIVTAAISDARGDVVKSTGDGLMAVFEQPTSAVEAAMAAQRGLFVEPWDATCPIRVRMGIHTGDAQQRGGDFFGPAVNRTARVMAAGHGGQILVSGATSALLGNRLPPGAALRDLGDHRLKDLGRPERLFQVTHPDLTADFPPLATLDIRPNNLPTQTSPFVGRDGELKAIRDLLDDPAVRLVTLTGPGGSGKTRLGIRAAADQIDRFDDGVFFVDLISATGTDSILTLVAAAVVPPDDAKGRPPLEEVRRHLRPRQVLLVLDTFEHVTSAAPALVDLLAECPGLKLLVTSRQALRVRGEHVLSVPPLSLPGIHARATTAELSQFEAIQLFVERARAVRDDFRLTDDNAAAVLEICRRLDGLPLAIELATARLNLFSPEALRDRLGSRLKLLGGGPRDLPARQQTLRSTIEWSYQLLEPDDQRLLELLSVFAASTVESIEAVAAETAPAADADLDPIDGLGSLLDKSLIRQTEASAGAAPRIVMLETIREFATERLEALPEFAAAARDNHARHYTGLAEAAWATASGDDGARSLEVLAADLDNLTIAWRHWVAEKDLDALNRLVDGLWHLAESRGWYHRTLELIRDLLDVLETTPPSEERWTQEVMLRTSEARALTMLRGYTGEVEDAYAQALELFEGHGEVPQLYPILRSLASFHGFRAEYDKGLEYADAILRLARARNDASMKIDGDILIGAYLGFVGRIGEGLEHLNEAIATFETGTYRSSRLRLGIDPRISCLTTSAFFLWLLGYPDQAVPRAARAVELATELDHPYSLAYAHFHAGFVHLWRREPEIVAEHAKGAVDVAEASDLSIWRALGTCLLGAATTALGQHDEGLRQIAAGIDQYQGLRTPPVFWPLLRYLQAGAHLGAGRRDEGLALIDEAIQIAGPDEGLAPLFHIARGDLLLLGSDADRVAATSEYEEAATRSAHVGTRMVQLRAAVRLCRVASAAERPSRVDAVRELYATFTEGLDTPDLRDAAREIDGS